MTSSTNYILMSENSLLPTLYNWLVLAEKQLAEANIKTGRLDALVLLSDELHHDKAWLLAHPEHKLTATQQIRLSKKLAKRQLHIPLAYIRKHKEFYGREFLTTNKVLVPRPETETLITQLLALSVLPGDKLIDVGTGSGAIAITAKLERPGLTVYATDISTAALKVAAKNAERLNADITFWQSDLLSSAQHSPFKFIVANLPYVSKDWYVSPETAFEPANAIFAEQDGLALIKKLIVQSKNHLSDSGYLLLEADPRQHQSVIQFAQAYDYAVHSQQDFILAFYCAVA